MTGLPDGPSTARDEANAYLVQDARDIEASADTLAVGSSDGLEAIVGRWSSPVGRLLRTILALVAFFLIVALAWELFKWVFGDPWRFPDILGSGFSVDHQPPFRLLQATDVQLPHVWDIASALTEPVQRNQ